MPLLGAPWALWPLGMLGLRGPWAPQPWPAHHSPPAARALRGSPAGAVRWERGSRAARPATATAGPIGEGCKNAKQYADLIDAKARRGFWKKALLAFEEMLGRRFKPSADGWSALMKAFAKAEKWDRILDLFAKAEDYRNLIPDAAMFNYVIGASGKLERWDETLEFMSRMEKKSLDPDAAAYDAAARAALADSDWERALTFVKGMQDDGDTPDAELLKAIEAQAPRSASSRAGRGKRKKKEVVRARRPVRERPLRPWARPLAPKSEFLPVGQALATIEPGAPYAKELRLLQHVFRKAKQNDPGSVCAAIENFGRDVLRNTGRWLKVAGDVKSDILTAALKAAGPRGHVLEIGCYCGYSATRMSLNVPDCHICSLEVDPVHVVIARNVFMYGGLNDIVDVWTGHSKDLLPRVHGRYGGPGELHFAGVFMDQKGSLYERDLAAMEKAGVLLPDAVVIADNVLKPGAPLYLRRLFTENTFAAQLISVTEFAMPSEDWMSCHTRRQEKDPPGLKPAPDEPPGAADPPPDDPEWILEQLDYEADRMRERATGPGRSVTFEEWAEFAEKMNEGCQSMGIPVTAYAPDTPAANKRPCMMRR